MTMATAARLAIRCRRSRLVESFTRRLPSHNIRCDKSLPLLNTRRSRYDQANDDGNNQESQARIENKNDDDWIPPMRPLVGDLGQSHLYVKPSEIPEGEEELLELQRLEEEMEKLSQTEHAPMTSPSISTSQETVAAPSSEAVDWLATRRSKLNISPNDMSAALPQSIPVRKGVLLTSRELQTILESHGGRDVTIAKPSALLNSDNGYILATATSSYSMRAMAESLVKHLRDRNLHDMGVVGAELGVEGADDPNETWLVVDAGNYVVHVQDARTRKAVNLEALWFGKDGLRKVNAQDEEAVEDYVAENPVPAEYNISVTSDWEETLKELQKQRWTVPHKPVVAKPKKKSRSRRKQ